MSLRNRYAFKHESNFYYFYKWRNTYVQIQMSLVDYTVIELHTGKTSTTKSIIITIVSPESRKIGQWGQRHMYNFASNNKLNSPFWTCPNSKYLFPILHYSWAGLPLSSGGKTGSAKLEICSSLPNNLNKLWLNRINYN